MSTTCYNQIHHEQFSVIASHEDSESIVSAIIIGF